MTTDAHRGHPSTALGGPSSAAGSVGPAGRDPLPLAGRTVLVTGVSRRIGIGHAIACLIPTISEELIDVGADRRAPRPPHTSTESS